MTLTRALFVSTALIGITLLVLVFGNPQWKYCYMFQKYVYPKTCSPDPGYIGLWNKWDEQGKLINPFFVYEGTEVELRADGGGGRFSRKEFSTYYSTPQFGGVYQGQIVKRRRKGRFGYIDYQMILFNADGSHDLVYDIDKDLDHRAEFDIEIE